MINTEHKCAGLRSSIKSILSESVLTHDAANDRRLLGNENVLTVALVQYTWWTKYAKIRERKV